MSLRLDTLSINAPGAHILPFVGHITQARFMLSLLTSLADVQILELMEGGDLRNALSGPDRDRYQWYAHGQELAMDVVRGLAYLHENRVIHGGCTSAQPAMLCSVPCSGCSSDGGVDDWMRPLASQQLLSHVAGDLKSKNVLLSRGGATAKLSDVGMSRVLATTLVSGVSPSSAPAPDLWPCRCALSLLLLLA